MTRNVEIDCYRTARVRYYAALFLAAPKIDTLQLLTPYFCFNLGTVNP